MRVRLLVLAPVAAILAGGVAYGVVANSSPDPKKFYSGQIHGPRPAPNCLDLMPACPEVLPSKVLDASWDESAVGFRFEAPPKDAVPKIDGTAAVNIAWQEEAAVGATRQQATLVLIPQGGDFPVDVLAWVVRYDGYCSFPVGGYSDSPAHDTPCQHQPYFTAIDADTGEFIISWTRPD